MPSVKTAVSITQALADEADSLARELRVTRSRLYAMALEDFIRRHEDRRLLERLNEAHAGAPEPEEEEFLSRAKAYHRRRIGD